MLGLVLETRPGAQAGKIIWSSGDKREAVMAEALPLGVEFVHQEERKGTGHAVSAARSGSRSQAGDVLIVPGDLPLLRPAALKALFALHRRRGNAATVLSAERRGSGGIRADRPRAATAGVRIVEEMEADSRLRSDQAK